MDKDVLETKLTALIRCVHQYENLDCKIIYAIITKHLDDFRDFSKEISSLL
ncbi:MAG: DUF86 domain-containing protein [Treponema sp.]|nr:DUF86 domain-containing protein [Treponema sp.]